MSGQSRVRASNARPPATQAAESVTPNLAPDVPLQRLATTSGPGSRRALLALQGAAGNRAVQRLVNDASALEEPAATASPDLFNVPDAHLPAPGGGQPIPDQVRRGMEGALGQDFSDVRVHTDSSPDSVGALAYTQGTDVHFRPGMYQPDSQSGREALGHELAHVVQQRAGRVATPQGMGAPVNADPSLEAEADAIGKQAARAMESGAALSEPAPAPTGTIDAPAQRIAAPVQRLGRGRSASLAALEERQLVSSQRGMFEQGGGGGGAAATTAPAEMAGGAQAMTDAVPATDEDTGAPEGAAEAVTALGSQAEPMAAALEEMAAAVGPDNVLDSLQAEAEAGDSDTGGAQADTSGLTSVPSSAAAISEALSLPPPQAAMPILAQAAESDGSPQTEEWSDWDDADMPATRGRSGAVFEAPSASPLPTAAPAAARLQDAEVADDDDLSDWDDADAAVPQASLPDSGPGGVFRSRSGAIDLKGGSSAVEDSGTGMTVGGVLGTATQTSAEKSRDWLGAAGAATSQTAMIAQGAGGILGGGAALVDAGLAASRAHVSSGAAMAEEGARASSALTGGAASVSNAAVGIEAARTGSSGLSGVSNAVMTGAGTAAAGLSIATGSIDLIRGVGGAVKASSRASQLEEMAQASGGSSTDLGMAARGAAETQRQKVTEGAVTAGKGALSVAGGAVLLALGLTNPIGLGLLAGAAVVGGAYALYKLWKNKRSKNKDIGGGEKNQGEAKAELAATLFSRAIAGGESEYQAILVNLGFDADKVRRGVAGGITQAHILQRLG